MEGSGLEERDEPRQFKGYCNLCNKKGHKAVDCEEEMETSPKSKRPRSDEETELSPRSKRPRPDEETERGAKAKRARITEVYESDSDNSYESDSYTSPMRGAGQKLF